MKSYDVIGYTVEGEVYCPTCSPANEGDDVHPIFADSETDSFSHCVVCEEVIPEALTSDGQDAVLAKFRSFLIDREGRPEIIHQWAEAARGYGWDADEKAIVNACWEASDPEVLPEAQKNEIRRTGLKEVGTFKWCNRCNVLLIVTKNGHCGECNSLAQPIFAKTNGVMP